MPITNLIDSDLTLATEIDSQIVPLEKTVINALAKENVGAGTTRDKLLQAASNPMTAADPRLQYKLQVALERYNKQISVRAALMSHVTKGVETLLKS